MHFLLLRLLCLVLLLFYLPHQQCFRRFRQVYSPKSKIDTLKIQRIVLASRYKEKQIRDKQEHLRKQLERKQLAEANEGRSISLKSITDPSGEAIFSLYLRRKPFTQLTPKPKKKVLNSNRQRTIIPRWIYYKDIYIQEPSIGKSASFLSEEVGGSVEETAQNFIAAKLRARIKEDNISATNAYEQLIGYDPNVVNILEPKNIELGFQLKKTSLFNGKAVPKIFEEFLNPIFPLEVPKVVKRRSIMDLGNMDSFNETANRNQSISNRLVRIQNYKKEFELFINNTIIPKNITSLLITVDGSATFHDQTNQTHLCLSAGIWFVPLLPESRKAVKKSTRNPTMRKTKIKTVKNCRNDHIQPPSMLQFNFDTEETSSDSVKMKHLPLGKSTLLFSQFPMQSWSQTPFDAELLAGLSGLYLANLFLSLLQNHPLRKRRLPMNIQFRSDSRALVKVIRDSLTEEAVGQLSSGDTWVQSLIKTQLKTLQHQLNAPNLHRKHPTPPLQTNGFEFKWFPAHPESNQASISTWNLEQKSIWLCDKIAGWGIYDRMRTRNETNLASPYLNRLIKIEIEKDSGPLQEFSQLEEFNFEEKLKIFHVVDLINHIS
jgi:hypothetical protein